ncbi:MAG: glycosyltransferase family 4 protein [Rhodobacteraceae bacterium]|nr:glycosyltransferase family 4 protein [Paracoccaceae bacterium]
MNNPKIIHFTTLHPRTDTRIRIKETATLAARLEAEVLLYVQDGKGDDMSAPDGVKTIDTGPPPSGGRLARMTRGSWRMYRAVRRARPDVAHFHDPELIPIAILLKLSGIKIIYDVHEDLPRQIMSKQYITPALRKPISCIVSKIEQLGAKIFDHIIPATPEIAQHFPIEKKTMVQNYPLLGELLHVGDTPYKKRAPDFVYVGGITQIRGILEILEAIGRLRNKESHLLLGGAFSPSKLKHTAVGNKGWQQVDFYGWIGREKVSEIFSRSRAGLVLFHPEPNHLFSQPNKLFEYMSAGLPIIASDFPYWRSFLDEIGCAIFVDPQDPEAIAAAMEKILSDPQAAEKMGLLGKKAVEEKFNWEVEADELVKVYHKILRVTK